jgi:hypothetical protein
MIMEEEIGSYSHMIMNEITCIIANSVDAALMLTCRDVAALR